MLKLWSVKGSFHIIEPFKKSEVIKAYTITGLTILDSEVPLIYNITPNSSDNSNFSQFIILDVGPTLMTGDYVISDNQNYHVSGWAFNVIIKTFKEIGVHYHVLPTYNPELNPIELVWS
jgi:transposase